MKTQIQEAHISAYKAALRAQRKALCTSHVSAYRAFCVKHRHGFASAIRFPLTPRELYAQRKERESEARSNKKAGVITNIMQHLAEMDLAETRKANPKPTPARVVAIRRTPRARRHGEGSRSSAASGDGNPDSDDPEPERRQPLQLLNQQAFADLLVIDKHTLQNIFSKTPWLLPVAVSIPGARGPRWTPQAVQAWLENRPAHSSAKPIPQPAKNKVGRPRIALAAVAGVQS
jgi:hypothetical protein